MLIACPSCATAFRVSETAIPAAGRKVRCSSCAHVWQATPADLAAEPVAVTGREPALAAAGGEAAHMARTPEEASAPLLAWPEADDGAGTGIAPADSRALPEPATGPPPVVDDAPPLVPGADEGPAAADDRQQVDIETIAQRRRAHARSRRMRERTPRHVLALRGVAAVFAGLLLALLAWREEVVRQVPNLAGLYAAAGLGVNLRGLEFHRFTATREAADGVPMLVIEGHVFNPGPRATEVPRLRLAVLGGGGRELYVWTAEAPRRSLSPGESARVRSRIASPPQDGRDILVRFHLRRDLVSATP